LAFGQDVVIDGVIKHTLCVVNDNDFLWSGLYSLSWRELVVCHYNLMKAAA